MKSLFRNTVFFSFLGHLTVFSLFSFSFGYKVPSSGYAPVVFCGSILSPSDLAARQQEAHLKLALPDMRLLDKPNKELPPVSSVYVKPAVTPVFNTEKTPFIPKTTPAYFSWRRKEPVIMFYPHLPYNFLLYFQDRQAVHIEIMFNVIYREKTSSVVIKRKISSGNLEADLFTLRYLGHYLFIQQSGFPKDNWQTVKIDLSTKND